MMYARFTKGEIHVLFLLVLELVKWFPLLCRYRDLGSVDYEKSSPFGREILSIKFHFGQEETQRDLLCYFVLCYCNSHTMLTISVCKTGSDEYDRFEKDVIDV